MTEDGGGPFYQVGHFIEQGFMGHRHAFYRGGDGFDLVADGGFALLAIGHDKTRR